MKTLSEQKKCTNGKKMESEYCSFMQNQDNCRPVCFDTVKLSIPIKTFKLAAVMERVEYLNNLVIRIPGLVSYSVYNDKYRKLWFLNVEVSAKFLGKDYFTGITKETYPKLKDFIKEYFGAVADIRDSTLMLISADIKYDYSCEDANQVFNLVNMVTDYDSMKYTKNEYNKNGIIFLNKLATKELRYKLTIYNKSRELLKAKNKDLVNSLKLANAYPDDNSLIRFELKMRYPQQINYFLYSTDKYNKTKHTLKEVLELNILDEHPISRVYKSIFPDIVHDSAYTFNAWKGIMKSIGPMKFAQGIGIINLAIISNDSRKNLNALLKESYSSASSISKKRREQWYKSLPTQSNVSDEFRRALEIEVMRRAKKYFSSSANAVKNDLQELDRILRNL